jgi:hypothetical protein
MKLPASLMSVKPVQSEKQGRITSTKNEEIQSVENIYMLTLVKPKELALVDLNFAH